jgi:SAM-dependent methyltransferase
VDVAEIKERNRRIWGLGDYSVLSRLLEPAAEALREACGVSAGQRVLDVGAGDGNFALACARAGAAVIASDLSPGMVERGRRRSRAEGLAIEWIEADAEELPFEDESFDCVGSVFGAMIAPRPEIVGEELMRVARPGGAVGMTAWTPESFSTALFRVGRKFMPPPPELPRSEEWAIEDVVRERLGRHAASIESARRSLCWHGESPEDVATTFEEGTPLAVAARRALTPEQFEAMRRENLELFRRWNVAQGGSLRVESEYLLTVARKRG